MDRAPELTTDRWKEILRDLRDQVGEGRIRGFGVLRRLELVSDAGTAELRLGGDGESAAGCVCLFFKARRRIAADMVVKADSLSSSLPESVRQSLLNLSDLHRGVQLYVRGREASLMLPGVAHDRTRLLAFFLGSMDCIGGLLGVVGRNSF